MIKPLALTASLLVSFPPAATAPTKPHEPETMPPAEQVQRERGDILKVMQVTEEGIQPDGVSTVRCYEKTIEGVLEVDEKLFEDIVAMLRQERFKTGALLEPREIGLEKVSCVQIQLAPAPPKPSPKPAPTFDPEDWLPPMDPNIIDEIPEPPLFYKI